MIYYVVIGIVIMFLIEVINHAYEHHLEVLGEKVPKFSMFERIVGILTWPFIIGLVIKHLTNGEDR